MEGPPPKWLCWASREPGAYKALTVNLGCNWSVRLYCQHLACILSRGRHFTSCWGFIEWRVIIMFLILVGKDCIHNYGHVATSLRPALSRSLPWREPLLLIDGIYGSLKEKQRECPVLLAPECGGREQRQFISGRTDSKKFFKTRPPIIINLGLWGIVITRVLKLRGSHKGTVWPWVQRASGLDLVLLSILLRCVIHASSISLFACKPEITISLCYTCLGWHHWM